ncbi:MAG: signal recognition particle-docking protein FtsY [Sciscionella sp.]
MSTAIVIWIVVAVVVVLLVAIVVGLVLGRRRRVSLREQQESAPEGQPPEAKPKGGGYRAGGGISLAPGGTATKEPPATAEPATTEELAADETGSRADATTAVAEPTVAEPTLPGELPVQAGTLVPPAPTVPEPTTGEPVPPESLPAEPAGAAPWRVSEAPTDSFPAQTAPPLESPTTPVPAQAPAQSAPPAPVAPIEEIAPAAGRLERLRGRLSRSRGALGQGLLGLLGAGDLDEESWEEIEDTLLLADLGAATTTEIVTQLREQISSRAVRTPEQARAVLRSVLVTALLPESERSVHALPHPGGPAVVLIAGVNGTGKTTTTGKLGRVLVAQGRTVLLGAADTFRAAAVEQLATWAERVGAEVVRGKEGADPASVAFDAVVRGADTGVDAVLIDTAGRLHTKTGLMDELGKVKRVVEKRATVDEVLLVLDATIGQNGLAQARVFAEVVDVTGIVLTKLDGTAKGGIVFQVQRELGVPVKLVGLGEGPDDLAPFEPAAFVDALLG